MITQILRERRRRKWKSAERWRKQQEKKKRLERQLEKVKESLKPDVVLNTNGILISVHKLRTRQGKKDPRFIFDRKERNEPASDFGKGDFEALKRAIDYASSFDCDAA